MNRTSRFRAELAALGTPRADISVGMQRALAGMAGLAIIIGYTILAYRPENTLFPRWGAMFDGFYWLYYDTEWGEYIAIPDTWATAKRVFPSVAFAGVMGTILGLYMGVYKSAFALFGKLLDFLGNIPPNSIMIAFMAIFGFGELKYDSVIVYGVLPMIAIQVYNVAKEVADEAIFAAKTLGASNREVVWSVMFPMLLPHILSAVKESFKPAIVYIIAVEGMTGNDGIGHRFYEMSRQVELGKVFPYVMYLGGLGLLTQWFFEKLTRLLCPWYVKEVK